MTADLGDVGPDRVEIDVHRVRLERESLGFAVCRPAVPAGGLPAGDHQTVHPPSTIRFCPVMYLAPGEARKTAGAV